jgi:hypothetical protein
MSIELAKLSASDIDRFNGVLDNTIDRYHA